MMIGGILTPILVTSEICLQNHSQDPSHERPHPLLVRPAGLAPCPEAVLLYPLSEAVG